MHPFAVAPGFHKAGPFSIGEMAGYLGLVGLEDFLEKTDADFAVPHEVQQPEPGRIGQGCEEKRCMTHAQHIRLDACKHKPYPAFVLTDMSADEKTLR